MRIPDSRRLSLSTKRNDAAPMAEPFPQKPRIIRQYGKRANRSLQSRAVIEQPRPGPSETPAVATTLDITPQTPAHRGSEHPSTLDAGRQSKRNYGSSAERTGSSVRRRRRRTIPQDATDTESIHTDSDVSEGCVVVAASRHRIVEKQDVPSVGTAASYSPHAAAQSRLAKRQRHISQSSDEDSTVIDATAAGSAAYAIRTSFETHGSGHSVPLGLAYPANTAGEIDKTEGAASSCVNTRRNNSNAGIRSAARRPGIVSRMSGKTGIQRSDSERCKELLLQYTTRLTNAIALLSSPERPGKGLLRSGSEGNLGSLRNRRYRAPSDASSTPGSPSRHLAAAQSASDVPSVEDSTATNVPVDSRPSSDFRSSHRAATSVAPVRITYAQSRSFRVEIDLAAEQPADSLSKAGSLSLLTVKNSYNDLRQRLSLTRYDTFDDDEDEDDQEVISCTLFTGRTLMHVVSPGISE